VATQHGETDDFHVTDHLKALTAHVGHQLFDSMLVNDNFSAAIPPQLHASPVELNGDLEEAEAMRVKVVLSDVVDTDNGLRHDPKKMAAALMRIYYDKSQVPTPKPGEVGQLGA
jgi:2-phospho-L-lactate transferase/gluconeogenesis factor (CofD/UPF0052 family)